MGFTEKSKLWTPLFGLLFGQCDNVSRPQNGVFWGWLKDFKCLSPIELNLILQLYIKEENQKKIRYQTQPNINCANFKVVLA